MQAMTAAQASSMNPALLSPSTDHAEFTVPLSSIVKGVNPRTYFDPEEMEELTNSVRALGVLQPILVRPVEDKYQIIAGERRYRAALAAFGESFAMPVFIRELTDQEADAAALAENHERADMSPTEEAASAAKIVGRFKGDREEAARFLGWSIPKLEKRLALMNCTESVRKALNERQISLGHAELLAALAKDTQDKMIPVIIAEKKTIADLKSTIEKAAAKLSAAIFDKKDCAGCQHNSSLQASMFGESITDGSCTKPKCYGEKTEARLAEIADGLKEEYPVIRIVRIGDNSTLTKLEASGPKGVGEEQAQACRACSDFGAAVSALPQALGNVYHNQCFNTACNTKKIAARIKAEEEAKKPQASEQSTSDQTVSDGKAGQTAKAAAAPEQKAVSVTESDRIKSYRVGIWRKAMKKEIVDNPELSLQYLIALSLNGDGRHINSSKLGKAFSALAKAESATADLGKNAALVAQATPEVRANMLTLLAASAMEGLDVHHLQRLAKYHKLDLTKHWQLDKEFLDLLTKSEIEFICVEIGLNKAITTGFKKLFGEKKPDLIDKLLKVKGFNYSATIPKVLQY
jgi:PRTRC genetic system ParB family protein